MLEMVRGQCAMLGRQRSAMLVRQLLGVKAHPEAMFRGRLEQAIDLLGGEGDRLAECVDAGGKPSLGNLRDELVDDLADIMRAPVALVGWACSASKVGTIRTASLSPSCLAALSKRISLFGSSP